MNKDILLQKGFISVPHSILGPIFILDIGRNRNISISLLGTPNEMIYLYERHHDGNITESICIHNFDYDGYLTETKLNNIISAFT